MVTLRREGREWWIPAGLGAWSAAIALAPTLAARLALTVPPAAAALLWWIVTKPQRWLAVFFLCLLLTPPLPLPLGDSGVHLAPLFALLGIFAGVLTMPRWRTLASPVTVAFALFLAALLLSLVFAALYSGPELALHSLMRVALFAISGYTLLYAVAGPRSARFNPLRFAGFLFAVAAVAAAFACADFYFQFPAPAGYEQQFVWLAEGVFRRAQGLFYEASTLGNFCAFFLVMIAVALSRKREDSPCSRAALIIGGVVLAGALILSYSRASVVNVVVAVFTLACVRKMKSRRPLIVGLAAIAIAVVAIRFAMPSFWNNYTARIAVSFQQIGYSPNRVLSGRLTQWSALADFLAREPGHLFFGVGYKTLPYSSYIGQPIVADNTYLGLLVETGIVGLTAFLALNAVILRLTFRARASFFGEWIFCFWIGEMVQMLSGDLITYWRVLPVYFWVLGTALRECE